MRENLSVWLESSQQAPSKLGVQLLAQAREQPNARMRSMNTKPLDATAPQYDFVGIAG